MRDRQFLYVLIRPEFDDVCAVVLRAVDHDPIASAAKLKAAEPVERRAGIKGNAGQQST